MVAYSKSELKAYMKKVIDTLKYLSPKEILSYAIFNEADEVEYYRKLAEHARRESVKVLFIQMADESQEHHDRLYKLFKELYPDEEPVKIDAPPVEVAPFYPKFETVDDYIEALEYCMQSELFAKETYEILALKALNEESKVLFSQLAQMETDHYRRIKKLYDLLARFRKRKILPEEIEPGGYIFDDRTKARYLSLDLITKNRTGYVFTREHPEKAKEWFKREDVEVIWITNVPGKGRIPPKMLVDSESALCQLLENEKTVVLLENLEGLIAISGFNEVFECISKLRDIAISAGSYLIVHAKEDALEAKEWELLKSELTFIE
ncbi:DUF835 domain-containing protein [Thermococcus sp. Bubb.Bath]|uniref:DUF835 domain-containing protein n=1 Tax=Thermococcus sp. Bubb.Bath TaxID=1638242 RepID=UPI001439AF83|nr:DUF835 domain-containing protein [Thermococcus sp. Bubb.Bath]NJF24868.1 DUF835 domain-containing protein [Thermococcus sp. Bubb.Bath]